jgi:hypothetical protein
MLPALALALFATSATAAPVAVWTGPGDRACHGRCPREWAASHLSEQHQRELADAMRREPVAMAVLPGDVLPLMTHYHGGPVADTRGVVAMLKAPEPATGWRLASGAWFVKVHACQNWTLVQGHVATGGSSSVVTPSRGGAVAAAPALFAGVGGVSYLRASEPPLLHIEPGGAPADPAPIPPIPLPATAWLLLSALAGLWWRAWA